MNDTQTLTLSEFLLARIAEDEAAARAADGGPWYSSVEGRDHSGGDSCIFTDADDELYLAVVTQTDRIYNRNWVANQDHIARHDPDRVLAECEAKRRIVGLHHEMLTWCQGCAHELYPCRTITALALPYADHPDFDPAWR